MNTMPKKHGKQILSMQSKQKKLTNLIRSFSITRISGQAVGALHPDLSGAIRTLGLTGGNKHSPGRGSTVPRFIWCANI